MIRITLAASLIAIGATAPAWGAPTMMSAEWAKSACDAWNKDPVLVGKLVKRLAEQIVAVQVAFLAPVTEVDDSRGGVLNQPVERIEHIGRSRRRRTRIAA